MSAHFPPQLVHRPLADPDEKVQGRKVRAARQATIERGDLAKVNGTIVFPTGGSTAASSLSSHENAGASRAHILIEQPRAIDQTASMYEKTWHVGKLSARVPGGAALYSGRC
jgi:N-acetyl-anhydromuramyl-L-alanine amidase AmpD